MASILLIIPFCYSLHFITNPPSGNKLRPRFQFSTIRCILLHYSPTDTVWKLASNNVNVDEVTITLCFCEKQLIYFDPDNVKDEYSSHLNQFRVIIRYGYPLLMQLIFLNNKIQKYPRKTYKNNPKIFHSCLPNNIMKITCICLKK